MNTHAKMIMAVTEYDKKQEEASQRDKRVFYNPYALCQYLTAIEYVEEDIENGMTLEGAIKANFLGHLQKAVLKAVQS